MTQVEIRAAALRTLYYRMAGQESGRDHFRDLPQQEQLRWRRAALDLQELTHTYDSMYRDEERCDGDT